MNFIKNPAKKPNHLTAYTDSGFIQEFHPFKVNTWTHHPSEMRGAKGSRLARIFNSRQTLSKALPSILTIPDSLSSTACFGQQKKN